MAVWLHHRQRQAGKYAKRSYKLQAAPVKAALREQRHAKSLDRKVERLWRGQQPALPPRPDTN